MDFGDLTPDEQALRDSLCAESDPETVKALALEAIRAFRKLKRLDGVLAGDADEWFRIVERDDGDKYLIVNSVMAESARQANVFRQLLAEIRRWRDGDVPRGSSEVDDTDGLGDDD